MTESRPSRLGRGRPLARVPHCTGTGASTTRPTARPSLLRDRARHVVPDGGQFLAGSYTSPAGTRTYKLYIPSGYRGQALPLIVMLHGCTQSPDDFAAGTRMNGLAEEHRCFVVYPAQTPTANGSKCWNWFQAADQQRGQGEPSLIAGITRQIASTYHIDARRVYVAGLSAGGAMAVILGMTYPDLYAAIGIHSGLAYALAHDLPSALAAMQQGGAVPTRQRGGGVPRAAPSAACGFSDPISRGSGYHGAPAQRRPGHRAMGDHPRRWGIGHSGRDESAGDRAAGSGTQWPCLYPCPLPRRERADRHGAVVGPWGRPRVVGWESQWLVYRSQRARCLAGNAPLFL